MLCALIIEDNDDNTMVMTLLLENAGYRVINADSGLSGYDMAVKAQPDFILQDIQLPDIDGVEVLRRLRQNPDMQGIRVIAMTSFAMSGDRERLIAAGFDGYIEKPVDPHVVISQLEEILEDIR